MFKVKLPVFIHSDNSKSLDESGIDYTLADNCEIQETIFYSVEFIREYTDIDGKKYTRFGYAGDTLIVALKIDQVEKIIDEAMMKDVFFPKMS